MSIVVFVLLSLFSLLFLGSLCRLYILSRRDLAEYRQSARERVILKSLVAAGGPFTLILGGLFAFLQFSDSQHLKFLDDRRSEYIRAMQLLVDDKPPSHLAGITALAQLADDDAERH